MNAITILIAISVAMCLVLGTITIIAHQFSLNRIKSKTVGDGQHGVARFASRSEIQKTYQHIPYQVKQWRKGENLPKEQGIIVGCQKNKQGQLMALVDTGDVHALMIGASGIGKTAYFLYPNLEYACASGMSFVTTDTKGDLAKNYGIIAKENYGYNIAVLDLRNPTRSNGNNLLHLVNKYFDLYKENPKELRYKAKAEKYAKIIAKTIINPGGENFAQNQFFYDSAEGLLTAVILLLAEFLPPEKIDGKLIDRRHIVSVFKMVQDLLEPAPVVKGQPPKSQFQMLMDKLPSSTSLNAPTPTPQLATPSPLWTAMKLVVLSPSMHLKPKLNLAVHLPHLKL